MLYAACVPYKTVNTSYITDNRHRLNQWVGWPNLKAYSQISYRRHSQSLNSLHLFVALPLEMHFPKGIKQKLYQGEIRAIFP